MARKKGSLGKKTIAKLEEAKKVASELPNKETALEQIKQELPTIPTGVA